jgi:hypothetical protein
MRNTFESAIGAVVIALTAGRAEQYPPIAAGGAAASAAEGVLT